MESKNYQLSEGTTLALKVKEEFNNAISAYEEATRVLYKDNPELGCDRCEEFWKAIEPANRLISELVGDSVTREIKYNRSGDKF